MTSIQRAAAAILKVVLPLLVLAAGMVGMLALVKTKPVPHKQPRKDLGTLVQAVEVSARRQPLVLQAQGSVMPARQVSVQPEVSGRVTWKNKSLVPGGRFKQGEVLLRIDPRQYAIEAEQRRASIDQAEQQLSIERARREIAREEWQIIGQDGQATAEGRAVALREPQLRQAEASLQTAESAASLAKLNLGRTTLVAPFNGLVQATTIDVGQLVAPQSQLATLVGTDAFWVQASVPVKHLKSIKIPGLNAEKDAGSEALIWQDLGGERIEKLGKVVRLLGDLDPLGRMARVLVEIQDPLGLARQPSAKSGKLTEAPTNSPARMPLLVGAYVHVEIAADTLVDVIEVPRVALKGGDQVHVYGENDTLAMRAVNIVWRSKDSVLIDQGLASGERVIVSRIPSPVEGMKLRLEQASASSRRVEQASAKTKAP